MPRRKRLWDALPRPCDALILGDPQSLIYFANYAPSPFVFRASDAAAVLILEPDRATLVADSMSQPFLDQAHVDEVVAPVWYDGKHSAPHRKGLLVRSALGVLGKIRGARFGIESADVPSGIEAHQRKSDPNLSWLDLGDLVRGLRRAKDPDEVALIRRSVHAGEAGHAAALAGIKPGMTELDAFLLVQRAATEAAGAQVVVYGDFASGPRCETERGGPPTNRTIEAGDLFILDYSVVVHGYRADFTNTFAVGSPPTPGQRELFRICADAMTAAESVLRPGAPARAVDQAARGIAASAGHGDAYLSHTGHGLGLSHPEPPYFVPESGDSVVLGDVVAIEPGLYVPGVGGMRFEHNYLVTADGFETLTGHRITLDP
ncbi:MAG: Xaa-Pro peptidase family protein [Planctomycetia bacterium]|nr:Xaa-Pro peptidase family protein [Planctomycetia bacterium]